MSSHLSVAPPILFVLSDLSVSVIEHAITVGLKEISAVLAQLVSMDAEEGTHHYNTNYNCISKSLTCSQSGEHWNHSI